VAFNPGSGSNFIHPTEGCHRHGIFSVIKRSKNKKRRIAMTEDQKKQIAAFRFGVICELVNGVALALGEQERLICEKCARKWQIPFSSRTHISRSSILRWMRLYKQSGGKLTSLYPKDRSDRGHSRSLDEETSLALIELRKQLPKATVGHLIHVMQKRRLVSAGIKLAASNVYRFLHQHELMSPQMTQPTDRRKFEAELPNDLWQSDVMHGPHVDCDGKKRKSYLIAILDDHSRLIAHGQFYLNERLASYLDTLEHALLKRGLPRKLYVDNGPAFRSRHLEHITASLGIALIHSKPYTPQGRGKIERFFRTVRADFVTAFSGSTLADLNEAFELWLAEVYHHRKHSATGQSPFKRFTDNLQCLRCAPDNLKDYFRQNARRRVAKDRTVTLNGNLFEAPVNLIGRQVQLLYHADDLKRVEILHHQKSYGFLRPVNLHVNCRVLRDKNQNTDINIDTDNNKYRGGSLLSAKRTKIDG
jgi:putative transposase